MFSSYYVAIPNLGAIDTLPSTCASLTKAMAHCIYMYETQLWHFVLVTLLPTGQS